MLISFSKQFQAKVKEKAEEHNSISCFVMDDTDIEKTEKTIEFVGRIFNHVNKLYPLGFKMLLLAFWDGKSLIPADFSLHREKEKKGTYGMTKKELDLNKNINAVNMIKRAVKNGFKASYILMDSWFVNDYMIKSIRSINNGAILDVIPEDIIPKLIKNNKDSNKLMNILTMLNSDNPQFYTENDKMLRAV